MKKHCISVTIQTASGDHIALRHQAYMGDAALLIAPSVTATVRISRIKPEPETNTIDMGEIHLHGVMADDQKKVAEFIEHVQRNRAP